MTNWANPDSPISVHFTVREALWLPRWNRLANKSDGFNEEIGSRIRTFAVCHMDQVRDFIGVPIHVHCWYRPPGYNKVVKGAKDSAHQCLGDWSAVDWHADLKGADSLAESCNILKTALLPKLEEWCFRMEDNGTGATWIHIDNHPVKIQRFFKP